MDALKEHDLPIKEEWIKREKREHVKEAVPKAIDELMALDEPVDAVLFTNNVVSTQALKYINTLPIRVPDDLAIVSFDESDAADLFCFFQFTAGIFAHHQVIEFAAHPRYNGATAGFHHGFGFAALEAGQGASKQKCLSLQVAANDSVGFLFVFQGQSKCFQFLEQRNIIVVAKKLLHTGGHFRPHIF